MTTILDMVHSSNGTRFAGGVTEEKQQQQSCDCILTIAKYHIIHKQSFRVFNFKSPMRDVLQNISSLYCVFVILCLLVYMDSFH